MSSHLLPSPERDAANLAAIASKNTRRSTQPTNWKALSLTHL